MSISDEDVVYRVAGECNGFCSSTPVHWPHRAGIKPGELGAEEGMREFARLARARKKRSITKIHRHGSPATPDRPSKEPNRSLVRDAAPSSRLGANAQELSANIGPAHNGASPLSASSDGEESVDELRKYEEGMSQADSTDVSMDKRPVRRRGQKCQQNAQLRVKSPPRIISSLAMLNGADRGDQGTGAFGEVYDHMAQA